MTAYRRNFVPGGCFFFTVNPAERKLSLLTDRVELLRRAFRETHRRHPFTIDAIVVLPDHLHTVWSLPEGDADFAVRWQLIKSAFSRRLARNERISQSRLAKGERGIWQRRYWEHTIRDETDFSRHVTTCTSIRRSMGSSTGCATGRRRRFIVTWSSATILPIGRAICRMTTAIMESGEQRDGFRKSSTHPTALQP